MGHGPPNSWIDASILDSIDKRRNIFPRNTWNNSALASLDKRESMWLKTKPNRTCIYKCPKVHSFCQGFQSLNPIFPIEANKKKKNKTTFEPKQITFNEKNHQKKKQKKKQNWSNLIFFDEVCFCFLFFKCFFSFWSLFFLESIPNQQMFQCFGNLSWACIGSLWHFCFYHLVA